MTVFSQDKMEETADEMIAVASKLSKRVGGGAKGLFGRAKAAADRKLATLEQVRLSVCLLCCHLISYCLNLHYYCELHNNRPKTAETLAIRVS
jgi:hypothetical protein